MFQKISLIALSVLFFTGCHTTGGYKACGGKRTALSILQKLFFKPLKATKPMAGFVLKKIKEKEV